MAKTFQDLINEGQAKVLGIVSIVPMDDWNADTQYQKLNLVRHNGATYLAKGGSKNVEPGVTQDWQNSWMLAYLDGILSPDGTYPNLTAGRVMHALAWGNKNYDGSSAQTITAADLGLADVYKPQGSIAYSALPATPSADNYGYVWNITDDFTTDSRFIEGAGKSYSAGTNVGVINQDGQYYYDILGNFVDLSDYAKIDGNYQEMTVGQATNAQNAANVTSQIDGHDISDIFETDGTTVKNATQAQGAGYLAKELTVSNAANTNRYYKLCTFTSPKIAISNSFIFLINGIYGDQPSLYAAESGVLEWDIRSDSNGVTAAASGISILGGNLSTSDFFFVISEDLSTISLYCYLQQQYGALKITELSNSNLSYDVVFDGTAYTSAPSNAVYAVVRNNASEAEILTDGLSVGNSASSTIQGYYQFLTAPQLANYQQTNIRLEFTDVNIANYPESICGIELRYYNSPSAPNRVDVYVLYGDPGILNNVWVSVTANNGIAVYFYSRGGYSSIRVKAFYQGKRSLTNADNFNIFENTTSYIAELPADNTNTALPDLEYYSLITQAASAISDASGNNIPNTYARQNGNYPTLGAGTANSLTAVQIPNNADLNDYVGSEYWGKVFYASGGQAISNSPVPASYVFHLEVLRLSGNTVQVITAGSSSNNSLAPTRYFRYVSSNLSYGNWEEIVTADGSYPTLGAGNLIAAKLVNGNDLNNCVPATAGTTETWYCDSVSVATSLLHTPYTGFSKTFKLETTLLWKNQSTGQIRATQTLSAGQSDPAEQNVYVRSIDSSASGTTWTAWEEIVSSNGNYPTLGAGHLPNNYIYAGGSSDPKWYRIATITNAPNLAAASLLLSINGIFATQDNQYGAETGQIEFDAANASGTYSCSATLNYGNINTNNVCVVQNGSTAELYYHFDSNYQAILVTVMSFYGGSTASYELTNVGVSAAPSNAIYAVNRNIAAKGVTPATSSNSDDVATTAWVRDYLNISNNRSDLDAVFSATFTGTSGIRSLGESYYNHPFFAIKWKKTNSSSEAYTTTLFIPTDMITQGNTTTYFSLTDTEDYLNWWFNSSSSFQFECSKNTQLTIYFYDFNF